MNENEIISILEDIQVDVSRTNENIKHQIEQIELRLIELRHKLEADVDTMLVERAKIEEKRKVEDKSDLYWEGYEAYENDREFADKHRD